VGRRKRRGGPWRGSGGLQTHQDREEKVKEGGGGRRRPELTLEHCGRDGEMAMVSLIGGAWGQFLRGR
jgi:hypothetical protein